MALAKVCNCLKGSGPPKPRPPETINRASSSLAPSFASTWLDASLTRASAASPNRTRSTSPGGTGLGQGSARARATRRRAIWPARSRPWPCHHKRRASRAIAHRRWRRRPRLPRRCRPDGARVGRPIPGYTSRCPRVPPKASASGTSPSVPPGNSRGCIRRAIHLRQGQRRRRRTCKAATPAESTGPRTTARNLPPRLSARRRPRPEGLVPRGRYRHGPINMQQRQARYILVCRKDDLDRSDNVGDRARQRRRPWPLECRRKRTRTAFLSWERRVRSHL